MSDENFDVIIIGGGPGGYNCAIRCGQLGLKTLCIEKRDTLGGTCLNVGCIPSKALLHASHLYEMAQHDLVKIGIVAESVALDLDKMQSQKNAVVKGLTQGIAYLFKKNKVDHKEGSAKILGPGKVELSTEGTKTQLNCKHIVIATGSEVTPLPGVKIDEKDILSSTGALALEEIPRSMIVIGAGVIGLEMGSVWRRLGTKVTVVEYLDHIVPGMDSGMSKEYQKILKKQGLEFKLGQKVTGASIGSGEVTLQMEPAKGGPAENLSAEKILVAIGRRPFTRGLGVKEAGVELDERGFVNTDHFRTNIETIWAIGDVTHGPMLAHKAEDEAVAVAETITGQKGHMDYDTIPSVIYTEPEVAWVGKSEEELQKADIPYKVGQFPFMANSRARANGASEGFVKVLAHSETDQLLGVHMLGAGVGEMIAEAVTVMAFGGSSEDIARTCHPHPTQSEALRQAAMGVEAWTMQM